jgi:hypothetical protein
LILILTFLDASRELVESAFVNQLHFPPRQLNVSPVSYMALY